MQSVSVPVWSHLSTILKNKITIRLLHDMRDFMYRCFLPYSIIHPYLFCTACFKKYHITTTEAKFYVFLMYFLYSSAVKNLKRYLTTRWHVAKEHLNEILAMDVIFYNQNTYSDSETTFIWGSRNNLYHPHLKPFSAAVARHLVVTSNKP